MQPQQSIHDQPAMRGRGTEAPSAQPSSQPRPSHQRQQHQRQQDDRSLSNTWFERTVCPTAGGGAGPRNGYGVDLAYEVYEFIRQLEAQLAATDARMQAELKRLDKGDEARKAEIHRLREKVKGAAEAAAELGRQRSGGDESSVKRVLLRELALERKEGERGKEAVEALNQSLKKVEERLKAVEEATKAETRVRENEERALRLESGDMLSRLKAVEEVQRGHSLLLEDNDYLRKQVASLQSRVKTLEAAVNRPAGARSAPERPQASVAHGSGNAKGSGSTAEAARRGPEQRQRNLGSEPTPRHHINPFNEHRVGRGAQQQGRG